jgi:hypothetical protein
VSQSGSTRSRTSGSEWIRRRGPQTILPCTGVTSAAKLPRAPLCTRIRMSTEAKTGRFADTLNLTLSRDG